MAKPYASEMGRLIETLEWATRIDIQSLRSAVHTAGLYPLVAIGSGGSLTSAYALASLHTRLTGKISKVATPLEAIAEPLEAGLSLWLLTASGGNVDIIAAARALIDREHRQIVVLCGRDRSPLSDLCRKHTYIDLLIYPPPTKKDGFLATNSLFGFIALLDRAYTEELGNEIEWARAVEPVKPLLYETSSVIASWKRDLLPLWARHTTLILHGPSTRIGAIDLESKFTEAAIGHLQYSDYRNFAHGRHNWLAKCGETSAVIAFVTDDDRALAERTLSLIPSNIPLFRLELSGPPTATSLGALIAALRITQWAGEARGVDPGRPGIPEFGRKLFRLTLPKSSGTSGREKMSGRDVAAISRKSGLQIGQLIAFGELDHWRQALKRFRRRIRSAEFAGVVLDYDGTIVDTRDRFKLPKDEMKNYLIQILENGTLLAVATGRGVSAGRALRQSLPRALWSRVIMGYYNGAEIAGLDEKGAPDGAEKTCEVLTPIAAALKADPVLAAWAKQTNRKFQITLETKRAVFSRRLWDLANQVLLESGGADVSISRSSHSIDIVPTGVSKENVVKYLREATNETQILSIGDRGRWPGNDYELLRSDYALSVDETNLDPSTCWNLSRRGQRGTAVTLEYLSALDIRNGTLRFRRRALE